MRCGKCGHSPATVDEVKACYAGADAPHMTMSDKFTDDGIKPVKDDEPFNPPSEAQVRYLISLQNDRILPEGYTVKTEGEIFLMERPTVSAAIEMLKFCQKKAGASHGPRKYTMPEGRYALHSAGVDDTPGAYSYVDRQDLVEPDRGRWYFYEVDKPEEGRWAGYTFIKQLVGAPGNYKKIAMGPAIRYQVLDRIEADPKQAMVDYGLQSGVCGRCGSPLTDPDSLARGIGPICAGKTGWY